MLKHFFTIAFRTLGRQKVLTGINILGLSIGLACFSLFLLYAVNEFSFDRFHKNADNIYRVYRWTDAIGDEEAGGDVYMPSPLGPAMKTDLPDVNEYVRIRDSWGPSFIRIDGQVREGNISFADPSFFTFFNFPLKYGSPATALKEMQSLVVTRKKAEELFGEENVMGRTIEIKIEDEFLPFTITGIAENLPPNSSVPFEMMGNFEYMETGNSAKRGINNWNRSAYQTYLSLKEGSGLANDQQKLFGFRRKYYPGEEEELKKAGIPFVNNLPPIRYGLQALKEIHTDSKISGGPVETINPRTIWILLSIAIGVLLIACINFTTLAIGRSARRAKEVGVRKVIGGERRQLVMQFLAEAIVLSILSAGLGLLLANLLLPYFNHLSGRELRFSFSLFPEMAWMLAGLTILVGVLAGSYPAMILSGFKPIEVLKSKVRVSGSNYFTKTLVTIQFALSIGLIIATIIILQQTRYMSTKNPGFNKENVVMVQSDYKIANEVFPLFKQAVINRNGITAVAGAELGIGAEEGWSRSGFEYKGKSKTVYEYYIDHDYMDVMGIKLLAGRNFNPAIGVDSLTSVIVNEAMVKDFGWTVDNAVGQTIPNYQESKTLTVIGVIRNFHFRPFKEDVSPQMFHQFANYKPAKIYVRLAPGDPAPALAAMQATWNKLSPELPFKYLFLDESIDNFYKAEKRWSGIIGWAGGISVFLACLGLFGLAALTAVNRTKEIGIRKVLGASLPGIVGLLSKDFIKLVVLALIIAAPLAWYFMNKWLTDFAYRISIGWTVFIIAGGLAVAIAFITIAFQAIRAGIANPVKSLRTE